MRFLRTVRDAFATARSAFDRWQIARWASIAVTVVATTVAVLLASFVGVALVLT